MSSEISVICHFEASKIYKFLNFHGSEKKFRWPKHLFHIFPTYRKSISINRTNSHVHTTRRSERSAKKLKFDAATYRFKITMFKSYNCKWNYDFKTWKIPRKAHAFWSQWSASRLQYGSHCPIYIQSTAYNSWGIIL